MGTRRVFSERPSLGMSCESMEGVESPVVETKKTAPDLLGLNPRAIQRPPGRLFGEVEGVLDVQGVLLGERVVVVEPLGRDAEVAGLYVYVVEDRQEPLDVPVDPGEHRPREVLGGLLGDSVARQGGRHREDPRVLDLHTPFSSLCPFVSSGSGSGVAHELRKTYWGRRLR